MLAEGGLQFSLQVGAHLLRLPGQILLQHDVEVGNRGGAGDRVAAEGQTVLEAVLAGGVDRRRQIVAALLGECVGDRLADEDRAERGIR